MDGKLIDAWRLESQWQSITSTICSQTKVPYSNPARLDVLAQDFRLEPRPGCLRLGLMVAIQQCIGINAHWHTCVQDKH
jgi:hypothetical protein